jgi:hypothetical protein
MKTKCPMGSALNPLGIHMSEKLERPALLPAQNPDSSVFSATSIVAEVA